MPTDDAGTSKRRERMLSAVILLACLSMLSFATWTRQRMFIPGQWLDYSLGDDMTFGLACIIGTFALLGISGIYFLNHRKYLFFVIAWAMLLVAIFRPIEVLTYQYRYRAERTNYHAAIAKDSTFGTQYSEVVDGRKLTYWRWVQYGIDNALGIIYDPADRLSIASVADANAFEKFTHGRLFRIVKLEPCWYYVVHS